MTSPYLNVFVQQASHTFRMEDVYLVNIPTHGTKILTLAYSHVNKTNIGIRILTNVHGVQITLQYGMVTNALNVLLEHFTLEIDMFV